MSETSGFPQYAGATGPVWFRDIVDNCVET